MEAAEATALGLSTPSAQQWAAHAQRLSAGVLALASSPDGSTLLAATRSGQVCQFR
jgi:hypothetical protein